MDKPIVYFRGKPTFDTSMFSGHEVARVYAVDHPKLGTGVVRTSAILEHFDDGFETMNTIYKKVKHDNRVK